MPGEPSLLRRLWQRIRFAATGSFLCDSCKYDYPGACRSGSRPNAKACSQYQRR
jgi:hypothetical protein